MINDRIHHLVFERFTDTLSETAFVFCDEVINIENSFDEKSIFFIVSTTFFTESW